MDIRVREAGYGRKYVYGLLARVLLLVARIQTLVLVHRSLMRAV
jgi:hypothetical protein